MEEEKFIEFYVDTTLAWGYVRSIRAWRDILEAHHGLCARPEDVAPSLMRELRATIETRDVDNGEVPPSDGHLPNFGWRREHHTDMTLEDWARKHGMYDMLKEVTFRVP